MRLTGKIFILIITIFFAGELFSQGPDHESFTGSVVNKTGNVIRFTIGTTGLWIGVTSGNTSYLFWDTYASEKIKLEGLPAGGKYQPICKDINNLSSGETIIVNIDDKAESGHDFYCTIEPAVQ